MARYDPKVLQRFADALYFRANLMIVLWTLVVAAAGGVAFLVANDALLLLIDRATAGFVGLGVGAVLGYVIGSGRAFALKLSAQVALCQKQIEANTNRGGASS